MTALTTKMISLPPYIRAALKEWHRMIIRTTMLTMKTLMKYNNLHPIPNRSWIPIWRTHTILPE